MRSKWNGQPAKYNSLPLSKCAPISFSQPRWRADEKLGAVMGVDYSTPLTTLHNTMAIYHMDVRCGAADKSAGAKYRYVAREGQYERKGDLSFCVSANMPSWATSAGEFWASVDNYERANGRKFREVEFALPKELSNDQKIQLAQDFAQDIAGANHMPYTLSLHGSDGNNPHAHLLINERQDDGISRTAATWFMRANKKSPEKGGAAKSTAMNSKDWLEQTREKWANMANEALQIAQVSQRIDHRTLDAQGIDREPTVHMGPWVASMEKRGILTQKGEENREIYEREMTRAEIDNLEQQLEQQQRRQEDDRHRTEQRRTDQAIAESSQRLEHTKRESQQRMSKAKRRAGRRRARNAGATRRSAWRRINILGRRVFGLKHGEIHRSDDGRESTGRRNSDHDIPRSAKREPWGRGVTGHAGSVQKGESSEEASTVRTAEINEEIEKRQSWIKEADDRRIELELFYTKSVPKKPKSFLPWVQLKYRNKTNEVKEHNERVQNEKDILTNKIIQWEEQISTLRDEIHRLNTNVNSVTNDHTDERESALQAIFKRSHVDDNSLIHEEGVSYDDDDREEESIKM